MRLIKLILFLVLFVKSSFAFSQTSIRVFYHSGTTQNFAVLPTGKLYFASDNLYIKLDGSATTPTTIPVSLIRKIVFLENVTGVNTIAADKKVVLFPNPSTDFFKITSEYTEGLTVKVYSLTGQLVHQGLYSNDQNINVSNLATGLYLVQVNNSTLKFIKK